MSLQAIKVTDEYKQKFGEKNMEIESLQEQIRDLMIHVETQQQLFAASPSEIIGGTLSLGTDMTSRQKVRKSRKHAR